MRYGTLLACALWIPMSQASVLSAVAPTTSPATTRAATDILPSAAYQEVYTTADLMEGGKMVADPTREGLRYYVAQEWLRWQAPDNYRRPPGLFLSKDGGKTWRTLSRQFEFEDLFVHPSSGELFAIIESQSLKTDEDGFLQHCFANKIVRSADGHHWKDITRGPGYVADLVSIFQDPDHPSRICLGASVIRYCVLQYTDDAYSDWTWTHGGTWRESHPTSRPSE